MIKIILKNELENPDQRRLLTYIFTEKYEKYFSQKNSGIIQDNDTK
jgi:hypothetical protein